MNRSIEELEAELARQDEELERATAAFAEAGASEARVQVPASFFEELEEACRPRGVPAVQFVFGIRA
ncbi:MAG: hypothetical protein J0I07_36355 [Myxococcales bacterium]|nr:hypothetical protein [Myxococcales bacterium]